MAKRAAPIADTPQTPLRHFWAPSEALPLLPDALERRGLRRGVQHDMLSNIQAAMLTQLLMLSKQMTDGRKAAMVNMIRDFTIMSSGLHRLQADEANARTGAGNETYMGRVLAR